jgi:hypothetical protein
MRFERRSERPLPPQKQLRMVVWNYDARGWLMDSLRLSTDGQQAVEHAARASGSATPIHAFRLGRIDGFRVARAGDSFRIYKILDHRPSQ